MDDEAQIRQMVAAIATGPRSNLFPEAQPAYVAAQQYCADTLTAAGFTVTLESFNRTPGIHYRDPHPKWRLYLAPLSFRRRLSGVNLVARLTTANPSRPPLVLVAHLDTVRRSPGADDNASGVAVAVQAAVHAASQARNRNITVVLVDMEEIGTIGSREYVKRHSDELVDSDIVVLESVGFFDDAPGAQRIPFGVRIAARRQHRWLKEREYRGDFLIVEQRRNSQLVGTEVLDGSTACGLPMVAFTDPRGRHWWDPIIGWLYLPVKLFDRSDNREFWRRKLRAVVIKDTLKHRGSPYHQPQDIPDGLDYRRMAQLAGALSDMATRGE